MWRCGSSQASRDSRRKPGSTKSGGGRRYGAAAHGCKGRAPGGHECADRGWRQHQQPRIGRMDTDILGSSGENDVVKMLLREKADPLLAAGPNKENGRGSVPLDAAARNGHLEVVRELIRHCGIGGRGGASGGVDALEMAAQEHQVGAMSVLMDAGVVDTGAALRNAAGRGREAPVKLLLQQQRGKAIRKRAYVNSLDEDGCSALFFTVGFSDFCRPNPRVVRLLVDAGADATAAIDSLTQAWLYSMILSWLC